MLSLFNKIETFSSCRDRYQLPDYLCKMIQGILPDCNCISIVSKNVNQGSFDNYFGAALELALPAWVDALMLVQKDGLSKSFEIGTLKYAAIALPKSELSSEYLILVYQDVSSPYPDSIGLIESCVRMYENQIKMLDYSELDTLTRLLNRKTFEETFERMLISSFDSDIDCIERREHAHTQAAWLCVIDIDHFKRINDNYGHLFGDEVLLRMGDFMRKIFRCGDRLFRFGGEEFVVILNTDTKEQAYASFNRFRSAVETNEFPQVGQVTCSIGFTQVSSSDAPTDVIGRADEALYYAKEHGRNQVCCYECLIAEGLISKPVIAEAAVISELDMDALFA